MQTTPCYGLSYCLGMAPKNNTIMNKEDYYRSHASKQKCRDRQAGKMVGSTTWHILVLKSKAYYDSDICFYQGGMRWPDKGGNAP